MIYYTSDLHFGHKACLEFDNRPFSSVEEMDAALIERWNRKVQNKDTVYVLGDVSWYKTDKTCEIVSQLRGRKILVLGNHDHFKDRIHECFEEVCSYKEINLPGNVHVILSHYPIPFFNRRRYGAFMLYGHVHAHNEWIMTEKFKLELEQMNIKCNMFNVGCMLYNYEPVTLEEILQQDKALDKWNVREGWLG